MMLRLETDVSVVVVTARLVATADAMTVEVSVVKDVEKGAASVEDHVRIVDLAQTEEFVQIERLGRIARRVPDREIDLRGGHDVIPEARDAQSVLPVTSIAVDSRIVSHATLSGQSAMTVPSVHDLIAAVTTDRRSEVAVMVPVAESEDSSVTIVQVVDSHAIASRL